MRVWLIGLAFALSYTTVHTRNRGAHTAALDRTMSPAAGAAATIAVGRLVAHLEDRFAARLFEDKASCARRQRDVPPTGGSPCLTHHRKIGSALPITRCLVTAAAARAVRRHNGYIATAAADGRRRRDIFEFDRPPTVEEVLAVTVGGWKRP